MVVDKSSMDPLSPAKEMAVSHRRFNSNPDRGIATRVYRSVGLHSSGDFSLGERRGHLPVWFQFFGSNFAVDRVQFDERVVSSFHKIKRPAANSISRFPKGPADSGNGGHQCLPPA